MSPSQPPTYDQHVEQIPTGEEDPRCTCVHKSNGLNGTDVETGGRDPTVPNSSVTSHFPPSPPPQVGIFDLEFSVLLKLTSSSVPHLTEEVGPLTLGQTCSGVGHVGVEEGEGRAPSRRVGSGLLSQPSTSTLTPPSRFLLSPWRNRDTSRRDQTDITENSVSLRGGPVDLRRVWERNRLTLGPVGGGGSDTRTGMTRCRRRETIRSPDRDLQ